jgi:hypothetical protein
MKNTFNFIVANAGIALLLTGCGGGGGSSTIAQESVPSPDATVAAPTINLQISAPITTT